MTKGAWMVGSGGHARSITTILDGCAVLVERVFDDDLIKTGHQFFEWTVETPVPTNEENVVGVRVIVAIGDNAVRRRFVLSRPDWQWENVIHSSLVLNSRFESLGVGLSISPQVLIGAGAIVADHTILNTGSLVAHDCKIGSFVHLGAHAALGGHVVVEDGVFVGLNATITPSVRVGAWSIVGAGAVVTKDVPTGTIVVGNPARVVGVCPIFS